MWGEGFVFRKPSRWEAALVDKRQDDFHLPESGACKRHPCGALRWIIRRSWRDIDLGLPEAK